MKLISIDTLSEEDTANFERYVRENVICSNSTDYEFVVSVLGFKLLDKARTWLKEYYERKYKTPVTVYVTSKTVAELLCRKGITC